jgi:hypothetical protein
MSEKAKKDQGKAARRVRMVDDSVEAHGITDTGELRAQLDDSVEGHAVNYRPLDNGGTPGRKRY